MADTKENGTFVSEHLDGVDDIKKDTEPKTNPKDPIDADTQSDAKALTECDTSIKPVQEEDEGSDSSDSGDSGDADAGSDDAGDSGGDDGGAVEESCTDIKNRKTKCFEESDLDEKASSTSADTAKTISHAKSEAQSSVSRAHNAYDPTKLTVTKPASMSSTSFSTESTDTSAAVAAAKSAATKAMNNTAKGDITQAANATSSTSAGSTGGGASPSTMSAVSSVIKESEDIIAALECIAPMYGIPADNIIIDDTQRGIKVCGDNIIAPSGVKCTEGNSRAIICAIGAVLDNISQRINEKLDDYQMQNIIDGKRISLQRDADPSKGKVVGRYTDDNGDEIIAYDSGLVDSAGTPEASRKVKELRDSLQIPMYNPTTMNVSKTSYFSTEDDISNGVDMTGVKSNDDNEVLESNDVSENIQESAEIIDLIDKFHGTNHLGYDLLTSQGFDFVKPVNAFYQEASSKKVEKNVKPEDIKFMKFDNTNILKAVKLFNEARAAHPGEGPGEYDLKTLVTSKQWNEAVKCLEDQFDCHIVLRVFDGKNRWNEKTQSTNLYTMWEPAIMNKITISKSKGFQLNGLSVDIHAINKVLDEEMPKDTDKELFGQFVVSSILHELFHNIVTSMIGVEARYAGQLAATIAIAANEKDAKKRRIIVSNYVNTIGRINGVNLNRLGKRKLVKETLLMVSLKDEQNKLEEVSKHLENSGDGEIDKAIAMYSKYVKKYEKQLKKGQKNLKPIKNVFNKVLLAIGAATSIVGVGIPIHVLAMSNIMSAEYAKSFNKYKSKHDMEEYYCDMFAGMYKLPLSFLFGPIGKRTVTANNVSKDKLDEYNKTVVRIHELLMDEHPSDPERAYAAVRIAKQLLENDPKMEPEFKKYCQWIVDNYSSMEKSNITEIYNDAVFDPKECEDLDQHIQNLIKDNNIKVTESMILDILGDDIING